MSGLAMTPSQAAAAASATAQRANPIVSPSFTASSVYFQFYHADPSTLRCVVRWDNEVPQDVLVSASVPGAEIATLQTVCQRLLVDARAQVGAV
jgi:hypothetical protein